MRKRNSVRNLAVAFCLISAVLASVSCSRISDDKAIFINRLDKFANAPSGPGFTTSEQEISARNNLASFSKEFPYSNFADDAQFIVAVFTAGCPTDEDIATMEKLIDNYPESKLENYTVQYFERSSRRFGSDAPAELYMPYDLVLLYMKSQNSWQAKKWDNAVKYSSEFLKKVDMADPKMRKAIYLVYMNLLSGYKNLGKIAEGEEVKKKMIIVFPERKDSIERIWSLPILQ